MIVAFLSSLISAVEPNIFGCIIDESGKENIDNIKLLIILLIFILLGQSFFTYIANRLQLKIGTSIEIDLKKKVFSSILNMPVEKFNRLEKGQLMNNISDDINMFSNLFTNKIIDYHRHIILFCNFDYIAQYQYESYINIINKCPYSYGVI